MLSSKSTDEDKTQAAASNMPGIGNTKKSKGPAIPRKVDETIVYFTLLLFGISTGQIQPSDLIKTAGGSKHYGYYSSIFAKIHLLGVKWQYGLARACEMASSEVKADEFKLLLMKLAQVLRLGEDLSTFLGQELQAVISGFISTYERSMKSMDMLLEMYSTMMSTSSFLVASMALMSMISGGGDSSQMVVTVTLAITIGLASFVGMAYFVFPKDKIMAKTNNPDIAKIKKMLYMTIGLGAAIGVALSITNLIPMPLVISIAGVPLILPGLLARKLDAKVRKLDDYYPSFARHLGEVYSTVGSLGQSLKSVLRSDFGILSGHIQSMTNRVTSRIKIEDAFDLFSEDTGSSLISAGNTVMANAMVKGANMREVGARLSEITMKFLEIRRKRLQTAKAFESTIMIMHVLTLAVFSLINRLLHFLTQFFEMQKMVTDGSANFMVFAGGDPVMMGIILSVLAVALSAINAIALKVSQGGLFHTVWLNMAILLITGGIVIFGVDMFLDKMIGGILNVEELLKTSTGVDN
jgi:flagellar protein FlaJ